MPAINDKQVRLVLALILLCGGLLRVYGLGWGTDFRTGTFYPFHPDETTLIASSRWVGVDLRSIVAPYGKAPMYLLRAVATPAGWLAGIDPFNLSDNATARFTYRLARGVTALLGTLTLWAAFHIGARLGGPWTGLAAAFCLAFSPGHIQQSHYYTVDVPFAFWATLALALMLRMPSERRGLYIACGLACGLAAGTRLAGVWLGAPFLVAHLRPGEGASWRGTWRSLLTPQAGFYLLAAAAVSLACNPLLLLDPDRFFASGDLLRLMGSVKAVRGETLYIWTLSDFATTPYLYHLTHLLPWALGTPLLLAALAGACLAVYLRRRAGLVLLAWATLYFGVVGGLHSKPVRYTVPLLPPLAALGAWACILAACRVKARWNRLPLYALPVALVCLPTALYGLALLRIYREEDSRIAAARWIERNIPEGAGVLAERGGYPTYWMVPEARYDRRLDDASYYLSAQNAIPYRHQVEFFKERIAGADWIVIIEENRMRQFLAVPHRYPVPYTIYEKLVDGGLGFDLAAGFKVTPGLGGWRRDEEGAETTITAFDHPRVSIYRRRPDVDVEALLDLWASRLEQDPTLPDRYIVEGLEAYRNDNLEEALARFGRSTQVKPGFVLGHLLRRAVYLKQGRPDGAEQEWRCVAPYGNETLIAASVGLSRVGLDAEAAAFLAHMIGRGRFANDRAAYLDAYKKLSRLLDALVRWEENIGVLTELLEQDGGNAEAWFLLARAYQETGRLEQARAAARKALGLQPAHTEARNLHLNLGANYYGRGEIDSARAVYREAVALNPGFSEAHYNLGILHFGQGQDREAVEALREAARLDPDNWENHLALAAVLTKAGRRDEAAAAFRRVLELNPGSDLARAGLKALGEDAAP